MIEGYLGSGRDLCCGVVSNFDAHTTAWKVTDFQTIVTAAQFPSAFMFTVDELVREPGMRV